MVVLRELGIHGSDGVEELTGLISFSRGLRYAVVNAPLDVVLILIDPSIKDHEPHARGIINPARLMPVNRFSDRLAQLLYLSLDLLVLEAPGSWQN